MSYLLYINGVQIETYQGKEIALTKQNNDIADISNRNVNYSQNIKIPRSSKNTRNLELAGLISKNSNFAYKLNSCDLIDADTNVHLIRNGFAVLLNSDKDYNLTIYDGTINFFKAIENLTLTDVGLTDLNHIKNIDNIIETWTDTSLPYRYNIADYNGKFFDNNIRVNIDYQVPSASVKYLWERVFDFIGFEYDGAIFDNEEFRDLWLTYPKPVPTTEPVLNLVTDQDSLITTFTNADFTITKIVDLLPTDISNVYMTTQPTGRELINQAGAYRIETNGGFNRLFANNISDSSTFVYFALFDQLGLLVQENIINSGVPFVFNALQNYQFFIQVTTNPTLPFTPYTANPTTDLTGSMNVLINEIVGYTLGFDQAFINFKVTDFIKEIMVRFALTPFEVKNQNKVKFKTLDEIFQDDNVQDWSDKFHGQTNETYKLNRYAQNNIFKFKYNDTNHKHNDGRILIDNKNLAEETTLYNSRTFAIEPRQNGNLGLNVYPIWSKNVKDSGDVEYKELDNRFYFMRTERVNLEINLGSDFLGTHQVANFYYKENQFRCSWQLLINKWYQNINKILDFTKVITANIYLKSFEFANLEMDKMVYIDQLSSYYLINKVSNFIPNQNTKVELIKVEYFTEPDIITPANPIISIISYVIKDCQITFNLETENIGQPIQVELLLFRETFAIPSFEQVQTATPIIGTLNDNEVTFDLNQIPFTPFQTWVQIKGFTSIFLPFSTPFPNVGGAGGINLPDGCYVEPNQPDDLTITNIIYLGLQNDGLFNLHTYQITFDFTQLMPNQTNYTIFTEAFVNVPNDFYPAGWYPIGQTQMNINDLKQITFGLPLLLTPANINKMRISINNQLSNEFNI